MEKYVKVKFKEQRTDKYTGKAYNYKTELDVKEGDIVVVDTQYGFSIAKIVQDDLFIEEVNYDIEKLKEIVCICDIDAFNERKVKKRKEKLAMEKLKRGIEKLKEKQELIQFVNKLDLDKPNNADVYELFEQYIATL